MKKTFFVVALILASGSFVLAQEQEKKSAAPTAQVAAAQPAAQPAAAQPAAAQPAAPAVKSAAVAKEEEPSSAPFCLARGLCNICTGWLELPRCMIYDNGFAPVFGLIIGIPEGAVLTVARTCSGVYDILSFGMGGDTFHGKIFPHTIFNSNWVYKKAEK